MAVTTNGADGADGANGANGSDVRNVNTGDAQAQDLNGIHFAHGQALGLRTISNSDIFPPDHSPFFPSGDFTDLFNSFSHAPSTHAPEIIHDLVAQILARLGHAGDAFESGWIIR